jgi:hypothetical protein
LRILKQACGESGASLQISAFESDEAGAIAELVRTSSRGMDQATSSRAQPNLRASAELWGCPEPDELIRRIENLDFVNGPEEEWKRLTTQLCARAYDAEPREVLKMVRAVGNAACRCDPGSKSGTCQRSEIFQVAEHMLQSLSSQLHQAVGSRGIALLVDVVETIACTQVGSQEFLDMIIAFMLDRHHRDCKALSGYLALRFASALGRVSVKTRLRPRGVVGSTFQTNAKLLEVLEKRIAEDLDRCDASVLAQVDDYYLTRLCCDSSRRAILERMATLQLGLNSSTNNCLPLLLRLQASVQQELGETYVWKLTREARAYLARLRDLRYEYEAKEKKAKRIGR